MFESIILQNVLAMLDTRVFSLSESRKIVGGKRRLDELVLSGKVRGHERNGRVYFNAKEIALNAKNFRR